MAFIYWQGPSTFTGDPIMLLISGHDQPSRNRKTGPIIQTWIIRSDLHPLDAIGQGADDAICGTCIHRQKSRTCYVNVGQSPSTIYKRHSPAAPFSVPAYSVLRLGSYGDPAAIPYEVWETLVKTARHHVGYTHAWRTCDPRFKRLCMASVESETERREAHALGWRTFRVGLAIEEVTTEETVCPASAEAGHRLRCDTCLHCGGLANRVGDIFIVAHGLSHTHKHLRKKLCLDSSESPERTTTISSNGSPTPTSTTVSTTLATTTKPLLFGRTPNGAKTSDIGTQPPISG